MFLQIIYLLGIEEIFFMRYNNFFSRPGRSQGLLYKHLSAWLIDWLIHPLFKIFVGHRHAQTVKNGASSHKTNYIDILQSPRNWGLCLDITIVACVLACVLVCPFPPKRLCDIIINEIREDWTMEWWNVGR